MKQQKRFSVRSEIRLTRARSIARSVARRSCGCALNADERTGRCPHQITLVRQSFEKVLPIRQTAAALFYARLFALDPGTRALFRGDMAVQGAKLMAAIATIVRSFDRLETVLRDIRALAKRHVHYGVREGH